MEPNDSDELGIRDYARVLGRRKSTVFIAVLVVAGVALASALAQTPSYDTTASVLLEPRSNSTLFNNNAIASNDPARDLQTEIQVVTSQPIKRVVHSTLGAAPAITVTPVGQSNVIHITAQSTDPVSAAVVANTYANAYIDYRRSQAVTDALAAESQIQGRISDLQHQIDGLNAQVKGASTSQTSAILSQIDSLVQQQGTFKQQLGQLQVQTAVKSGGAQLIAPASTPASPSTPRPLRDVVLAMMAGLILGIGAAFGLEYFDDSLKSQEDLDRAIHGLSTLAVIPQVSSWKTREEPLVISIAEPQSPAAESYRALRTAIQFSSMDRPLHTLQITSPSPGEGKTTTLVNLGVALAQVGQEVILTCCDLRRPRLHEFFDLDNNIGFTSVLLGNVPASAALQDVPGVPGLRVLASGPLPPNPSELLSSARAAEVLTALRGAADMILIDSPPVLPVTDAAVLSGLVDSTLLVVTAGSTTRRQAAQAVAVLAQVDAPLLAVVLNGLTADGSYGSAYNYYRYEHDARRRWERGPRRRTAETGQVPRSARVDA